MSIESGMPSNYLILCFLPSNHLILLLLPSIFPSIRVFSNELVLAIRWPNYWSCSFYIGPSKEYSGLISFRIDWFALFAFQRTLKSLLQHHHSKASILRHSAFFIVQLSHSYMSIVHYFAFLINWGFGHFSSVFRAFLIAQLVKNPPEMQETLVQIPGLGRSAGERIGYPPQCSQASLVA